jgi:hypothetical protein
MGAGCQKLHIAATLPTDSFLPRYKSFFINDPSAYDPKSVIERICSMLSTLLLPELIAIIIEGAASLEHSWTPRADLGTISVDGRSFRSTNRFDGEMYGISSIYSVSDGPLR